MERNDNYRGRGSGNYRGRGNGNYRGRGNGRYRGDHRGSYGGRSRGTGRDGRGVGQWRPSPQNADRVRDQINCDRREECIPTPNFPSTGEGASCSSEASLTHSQICEPERSIASSARIPENNDRRLPMMRPDKGGGFEYSAVKLHVNHFPVKFNPNSVIMHYNIEVKTVESSNKSEKLQKVHLSLIRQTLFTKEDSKWPLLKTGYDGEKNIYSAIPLPEGEFDVELPNEEEIKHRKFKVSVKLVNELQLCKLRDYLTTDASVQIQMPGDVLQGMNVVMKENPVMCMISVGRSFHPIGFNPKDDLKHGITASRGIQHSLKPTSQGLALCLDYSVLALRKKMGVIDFLKEHIPGFMISDFGRYWNRVEMALRGVKVNVTHRRTKQKYIIVGLTEKITSKLDFSDTNDPQKKIFVVDYFQDTYNKKITHQNIPCLDLSKKNQTHWVPMEFCVLAEGQVYPKEYLDFEAGKLLKSISLANPWERKNRICDMVRSKDGPCGGNVIQNFEIGVSTEMTSVIGRVILPPVLNAGKSMEIKLKDGDNCQWNLIGREVVKGETIDRWAVIDFSSGDRCGFRREQFAKDLITKCQKLGMTLKHPSLYKESMSKLSDHNALYQLLNRVATAENLQLIICAMSKKHDGYNYLKWVAETRIGVMSQCCLTEVIKKGRDQYLSNLALKINAKLGGSNMELSAPFPHFEDEKHVMFLGADVNHPASRDKSDKNRPSIAAVVATVNWPKATRYVARLRPQYRRQEQIQEFGRMCLELVETYKRLNKVWPQKIVLFRDGVSEGQFDMVLNEELTDMKTTFQSIQYFPAITVIVAQKRHQTRFFQEKSSGGAIVNVSPGTVVDTTVVHPFEFDFYLCSHHGIMGTSKPTHYHVLWDENGFSSDNLQQLIYNLCFTFARCTKPVSLVPPVYYADLVAYRGQLYYQALINSPDSYSSVASNGGWCRLSDKLKDEMFFV